MSPMIATVVAGCVAAGVISLMTFPKLLRRVKNKRRESKVKTVVRDEKWIKVGTVAELYSYPLMYGKEYEIKECTFQEEGLTVENEQEGLLRDKMFVVYDDETKCVQNYKNFVIMLKLKVTAPYKDAACFKIDNESLHVDLRQNILKKRSIVECKIWNYPNETLYYIECTDCGAEASEWISNALIGQNSGLRLGYYQNKTLKTLTLWENFGGLREMRSNRSSNIINYEKEINKHLPAYTMITEQSLQEVNKSLLKDKTAYDFNANLVISIQKPFSECRYEYLKIGDEVIISNTKPWKRPRISPIGIPNDLKLKLMSISCKVQNSGKVRLNDDVYIHATTDVCE